MGLRAAGLSDTLTGSSVAEGWAQHAECLLASGYVMLSKGSVGEKAEATAKELIKLGKALIASLKIDDGLRAALLDGGSSEIAGSVSPYLSSQWIREKDPDFDETAGIGDIPYASYPQLDEGSDL